ncbi:MAG: carbon-nitrogen hydrolase family protein [Bacteroidia bacterium]|nr:carbon-nitrogen hydrolase family protein [Bacteroidia bacterium]MBT8229000.1 carbon-nitrogen hydrolase family protein [Bacteroidia bacterium]
MKVAIVQYGPDYFQLEKTIDRSCTYISTAAEQSCDLIVFGECWLSGYPFWLDVCHDVALWDHAPVKEVWARMFSNSVDVLNGGLKKIQEAVSTHNIHCVIGLNEIITKGRGNNTIYNTVITLNNKGEISNHHRKLMPTYTEKLVHGMGDGFGLKSVDTKFGRIGTLICWEHWMPMARQSMHDEMEDIHIALWPYVKEMHHVASRHYAMEGRCHVVSVGQICYSKDIPKELNPGLQQNDEFILKGGSAIYGPAGNIILEPVYDKAELITVEINLSSNRAESMNLSVSGHYQRPDIFDYKINKERNF